MEGLNLDPAQVGSLTNRPDFRARLARLPPELQERALSRLWTLTVRPKLPRGLADSEVEQSKQQFVRGVLRQQMPTPLERGQAPAPSAAMPGAPGSRVPLGTRAKEFGVETGKDVAALAGQFLAGAGTGVANIMRAPSYLGLIKPSAYEKEHPPWAWWEKEAEYFRGLSAERAAKHPILSGLTEVSGQIAPGAALAKAMPAIPTGPGAGVLKTAAAQLPKTAALAAPFAATPGELAGTTGAFAVLGAAPGALAERIPALRRLARRALGKPLPEAPAAAGAGAAGAAAGAPPAPIEKTLLQDFEAMSQKMHGKSLGELTDVQENEVHKLVVKEHIKARAARIASERAEAKVKRTTAEAAKETEKDTKVASRLTAAELRAKANKEVGAYKKAVPAGARNLEALENLAKGNITAQEAIGKYHATQQATTASTTEAVAQATAENPQLAKAAEAAQTVRQAVAPSAGVTRMSFDDAAVLIRSDEVIRNAVAEHMKLNPEKKAPQALRDVLRGKGMNVELAETAPRTLAAFDPKEVGYSINPSGFITSSEVSMELRRRGIPATTANVSRVMKAAIPKQATWPVRKVAEIDNELVGLEQEAGAGRVSAGDYIDRKRKLLNEKARATGETGVAKQLRQEQTAESVAGKRKAVLRTEALTQQEEQLGGGKRTKIPPESPD